MPVWILAGDPEEPAEGRPRTEADSQQAGAAVSGQAGGPCSCPRGASLAVQPQLRGTLAMGTSVQNAFMGHQQSPTCLVVFRHPCKSSFLAIALTTSCSSGCPGARTGLQACCQVDLLCGRAPAHSPHPASLLGACRTSSLEPACTVGGGHQPAKRSWARQCPPSAGWDCMRGAPAALRASPPSYAPRSCIMVSLVSPSHDPASACLDMRTASSKNRCCPGPDPSSHGASWDTPSCMGNYLCTSNTQSRLLRPESADSRSCRGRNCGPRS